MTTKEKQLGLPNVDLTRPDSPSPPLRRLRYPLWTENKAKLIERYLFYFVQITKHGTYIDGFAGPQSNQNPDLWAAKLVLENEPRWLRNFHFCDVKPTQVDRIEKMVASQPERRPKEPKRKISCYQGDFNTVVDEVLSFPISEKEATFCLLDQRTFECDWATVQKLATHKCDGLKIELFYFLASGWMDRAFAAQQDHARLDAWWGGPGWREFAEQKDGVVRADMFVKRFKELRYRHVAPWPIFADVDGGRVMYYMIHATDHPEAPKLMRRAYDKAVQPKESVEQLSLFLDEVRSASDDHDPDEGMAEG